MSDKATLLREADEAFAELRRAVEGLTDEEMRRVWLGTWGVREILIHISGWHEAMAPALGRFSTSTGCPQASLIFWPTVRASTSVVLPAEKPISMRIGLAG